MERTTALAIGLSAGLAVITLGVCGFLFFGRLRIFFFGTRKPWRCHRGVERLDPEQVIWTWGTFKDVLAAPQVRSILPRAQGVRRGYSRLSSRASFAHTSAPAYQFLSSDVEVPPTKDGYYSGVPTSDDQDKDLVFRLDTLSPEQFVSLWDVEYRLNPGMSRYLTEDTEKVPVATHPSALCPRDDSTSRYGEY